MTEKYVETVQLGMGIEIEIIFRNGDNEHFSIRIVPEKNSNYELGLISETSPLAIAILGEKPGVIVPYFTHEIKAISIISVNKSDCNHDPGLTINRENIIRDTLNLIQFRDALLFAFSTDTKWGSYDADGLQYSTWHNNSVDDSKS